MQSGFFEKKNLDPNWYSFWWFWVSTFTFNHMIYSQHTKTQLAAYYYVTSTLNYSRHVKALFFVSLNPRDEGKEVSKKSLDLVGKRCKGSNEIRRWKLKVCAKINFIFPHRAKGLTFWNAIPLLYPSLLFIQN